MLTGKDHSLNSFTGNFLIIHNYVKYYIKFLTNQNIILLCQNFGFSTGKIVENIQKNYFKNIYYKDEQLDNIFISHLMCDENEQDIMNCSYSKKLVCYYSP